LFQNDVIFIKFDHTENDLKKKTEKWRSARDNVAKRKNMISNFSMLIDHFNWYYWIVLRNSNSCVSLKLFHVIWHRLAKFWWFFFKYIFFHFKCYIA
jgi:hypothetical protein